MPIYIKTDKIESTTIGAEGQSHRSIVRDGLLIYLDAQDVDSYSGSTTWYDLSGNSNHFTTVGGIYTSNAPSKWNFSGQSQLAYCANTVASDYFTAECVFRKTGEEPGDDILFNKENTWEVRTTGNSIQWAVWTSNVTWYWSNVIPSISLNTNYHMALTYDGINLKTYLNGVLQNTTAYTGTLANQTSYWPKLNARGTTQSTGDGSHNGNHDFYIFRLYNRGLSDSEVYQNYILSKDRFGFGGYYNCGYGCQYYTFNPNCTAC